MIEFLEIIRGVGKVIGYGKAAKNIADAVSENSAKKRKERELNKQIQTITQRNLIETIMMYVMAGAAGVFFCMTGVLGFLLVVLVFLTHCNSLYELSHYISVKREILFTVLLAVVFLACFI